jgi:hypothetical protein
MRTPFVTERSTIAGLIAALLRAPVMLVLVLLIIVVVISPILIGSGAT